MLWERKRNEDPAHAHSKTLSLVKRDIHSCIQQIFVYRYLCTSSTEEFAVEVGRVCTGRWQAPNTPSAGVMQRSQASVHPMTVDDCQGPSQDGRVAWKSLSVPSPH